MNPNNLSITLLATVIVLAALAHLAWGLASLKYNSLFILASAFIILDPLSSGMEIAVMDPMKYLRVYTSILIVLVGVFGFRIYGFRGAPLIFLVFVALYVLAAFWSDSTWLALQFKGLFALTWLAGAFMAYSLKDEYDLIKGMRILLLASATMLVILGALSQDLLSLAQFGRFGAGGINPNRVGQSCAMMTILSTFVALYDRSRPWKIFGWIVSSLMLLFVFATVSRGAAGMLTIGVFVLGLPLYKRPIFLTVSLALAGGIGYAFLSFTEFKVLERFLKFDSKNYFNRDEVWERAVYLLKQQPVIGHGWAQSARHSATNLHNAYLNVAVETGFFGVAIFALCLAGIGWIILKRANSLRKHRLPYKSLAFAVGLFVCILAHGTIESSVLSGSTLITLFFGFSIALIDRSADLEIASSRTVGLAREPAYQDAPQLSAG